MTLSLLSLRGAPIHRGDEAISEGLLRKEIAALHIRSARNDQQEEKWGTTVKKEGGKNEVNSYRTGAVWKSDC